METLKSWLLVLCVLLAIALIGWNIYSGATVQKIGIPGFFEIEFGPKATPTPVIMDVAGNWLTPFDNLSYRVTQDRTRVTWRIPESGASGKGTIVDNTLVGDISGQEVVYEVGESDSQGNPTVLYTTNPNFLGVVLFRTCDDLSKFVSDLAGLSSQVRTNIQNALSSLSNPTCPNVLP
jgi:hypothetical protein